MTKKTTKRALVSSLVMIALCFTMLVGTTFAWFTDSASSTGNVIKTGTLDVALYELTDANTEVPVNGAVFGAAGDTTLWEPNATYVKYFRVKNEGSLALKFNVALDVYNVANEINEVLQYSIVPGTFGSVSAWTSGTDVAVGNNVTNVADVTLAPMGETGDTYDFAIAIHMDHNAGNSYQNSTIMFDINVMATQVAYESDSFGNQYDAGADATEVTTAEDLQAALNEGGYVTMNNSITATNNKRFTIPANSTVTLDLNGYTLTSKDGGSDNTMAIYVEEGANFTLNDSVGTGKIVSSCYGVYVQPNATFTMNGGTISTTGNGTYDIAVMVWNGAFVMNGGTIEGNYGVWSNNHYRDTVGRTDLNTCAITVANNCTFNVVYYEIDIYDALDTVLNVPADFYVYNGQ